MTQRERVLDYIKEYGSITSLEAFRDIGCTRLSAVIFDLKAEGHEIEKEFETKRNRWGEKVSFARYSLKEQ